MLHIIIKSLYDGTSPMCLHARVGENLGMTQENISERVVSVLADDDELHYVLTNFTGLPTAKTIQDLEPKTEMSWFGDHAKFIVSNWT